MKFLMEAYLKLYRKFFENWLWEEKRVYSKAEAWIDLMRSARWGEGSERVLVKGKLITVNRGELVASARYLAKRWRWSAPTVSRFLNLLKSETQIETRVEQGETVIKLCKYETYNSLDSDRETQIETPVETPVKQRRYKEEEEKESKEEENYTLSPSGESDVGKSVGKARVLVPYERLFLKYEALCPSLIQYRIKNEKRRGYCRRLWCKAMQYARDKRCEGSKATEAELSWRFVETLFRCAEGSAFCRGERNGSGAGNRNWKADFEFVTREEPMARILEGYYDR